MLQNSRAWSKTASIVNKSTGEITARGSFTGQWSNRCSCASCSASHHAHWDLTVVTETLKNFQSFIARNGPYVCWVCNTRTCSCQAWRTANGASGKHCSHLDRERNGSLTDLPTKLCSAKAATVLGNSDVENGELLSLPAEWQVGVN